MESGRSPGIIRPARALDEFLRSRAASLIGIGSDFKNVDFFMDDLDRCTGGVPVGWTASIAGTGAGAVNLTDEGGGVHQATTGATAASHAYYVGGAPLIRAVGTVPWYHACRFKITTAVTAQSQLYCGLRDVTTTKTLAPGFWGALNAANFVVQYDGNEAGSIINLGVAVDTAYHVFEMWGLGDSKLHAAIDYGPDLGGVTMSAAPANACELTRRVFNGTDAVARTMRLDWVSVMARRT